MFSRFSDVLQTAADVLAPPATRLEDFEYHWKMIVNFYQNYDDSAKVRIEDTRVPHHLHHMLQLIVDEEREQQGGTVGGCLEAVVGRGVGLLDALSALCAADRPPGARALALSAATQLLRRTAQPCLNSPTVFRPLQRMLIQCGESKASPTEKEEVELLLTLCGLVRKDPGLANIFTSPFVEDKASLMMIPEDIQKLIPIKVKKKTPRKNPLFEIDMSVDPLKNVSIVRTSREEHSTASGSNSSVADENASSKSHKTVYDENDRFLLMDLLLSYLNSADVQVVLRACEGILMVVSLPEEGVSRLVAGASPVCDTLAAILAAKLRAIPSDVDPADVDHLNITWAYVAQDLGDKSYLNFHGYRELTAFFSWLDYCDTLMKECQPTIGAEVCRAFRSHVLEGCAEGGAEGGAGGALLLTAVLAKSLKLIDSPHLIDEFSNWLVGEGEESEWPVLQTFIDNCLRGHHELTIETLRFFETILEKGTEHSIHRLVLARVCSRGYLAAPAPVEDDERDRLNDLPLWRERERNREALKQLEHEEHVRSRVSGILAAEGGAPPPHYVRRLINRWLVLVPRALLSDPVGAVGADFRHYIHDAHTHYQLWLDITAGFKWPAEVCCESGWVVSARYEYDTRPEADMHLAEARGSPCARCRLARPAAERFDEGPFLRMVFRLLLNMPAQPYQLNLQLTALVSKLCLLPHAYLYEYLLDPTIHTATRTRTLYKTLREVACKLTAEIPALKNYRKLIENTRHALMSEDPNIDDSAHNQLVESLIVLEEFCKELAAIAFVKYQHHAHAHAHRHSEIRDLVEGPRVDQSDCRDHVSLS